MERLSVTMVVWLLAASQCQAGGIDNLNQEANNEIHANNRVETDSLQILNQGLEAPVILTTNSTETLPSCERPIYTVLKELGALEEKLAATVRTLEETNKKLEASEKKLSALDSRVTELSTVDQGRPRVAFSAALPVDGTIGPLNVLYTLVYKRVLSNIGERYSPVSGQYSMSYNFTLSTYNHTTYGRIAGLIHKLLFFSSLSFSTGYFTATVQGVYYFTFTSFCWAGNEDCGSSLFLNENQVVSWYGSDDHNPQSGSNSAVLQLQVGDNVSVRVWHNRRISDNVNKYCSFSGFWLFPL
ncbi:cerebellin 11 isoform X1 [Trematomus bernacchii]|uniref:cerebellin 11 isoform X1 n=1 Tax=Trematomus bernacchii TaxID=40690 RepID=UPI00146F8651|nr:cerebellin 11 isoform X1 [Trematomus bernacchii]